MARRACRRHTISRTMSSERSNESSARQKQSCTWSRHEAITSLATATCAASHAVYFGSVVPIHPLLTRMPQRPSRSLKHEYELFVEREIENYKESVPRS